MNGLEVVERGGIRCLTDRVLASESGIVVAFSGRKGGSSEPPYASLDLAAHVGDDPAVVDANRMVLLHALGIGHLAGRLTSAEQVHGLRVAEVSAAEAGMGASVRAGDMRPPVPATDALVTRVAGVPLMMLFADCVPVVLVVRQPVRAVAVVHAGWKGALGRLPGKAAIELARISGCATSHVLAYVGPHVCAAHYQVDAGRLSHFTEAFGSIAAARGGLDLGAVVSESLSEVGLPLPNVVRAAVCTAERTDEFYSFRAEGTTGRHAALSVILEPAR